MRHVLFIVLLSLFNSTMALGQETRSAKTTEGESPCTLHPVNGRICVSEEVLYRFLVQQVAPKLPDAANGKSEVVLHVIVGKYGGKPARIAVISEHSAVARSVVRAVKHWVFKPYIYNGEYVEMESDIHLRFPDPNN